MQIILASQSPRRRELMSLITAHFATCVADFDEEALHAATPATLALLLAEGKAKAAAAQVAPGIVIGCDTVVELDGRPLGKPHSREEAVEMLGALAGQTHHVHTGVAIMQGGAMAESFIETTAVTFAPIPKAELEAYADTDEPYDKAGGYGIQGWAARFIPKIEGCYYNVMGLPVASLYAALRRLGAEV